MMWNKKKKLKQQKKEKHWKVELIKSCVTIVPKL